MGFLNKVKRLFSKGKNISLEEVSKVTGEPIPNEIKKDVEDGEESKEILVEDSSNVFDKSIERSELLEILNSVKISSNYLGLERIQGEAETISNYVRGLLKDLEKHEDLKDKTKLEGVIGAIGKKIKLIASHGLELKNLLGNLENHYYIPVLDVLKKVNEKLNNEEISKLIKKLENDLELVKGLDTKITRVAGYDGLFNPDKSSGYREEISKEAKKRLVHGHLNELLDTILAATSDKTLNIKSKIEKENPLEIAKKFI